MAHFLLPLAWLLLITILSLLPGVPAPPGFNLVGTDKIGHAFVYAVLVWLMARAWMRSSGRKHLGPGQMALLIAGTIGYGILMEWAQLIFSPSRHFEYDDMAANGIGAVIGGLMKMIKWRSR
jgi:VanZ family protein